MEKDLKELLGIIIKNQVILYRKLDILQSKLVDNKWKAGYSLKNASDDIERERLTIKD